MVKAAELRTRLTFLQDQISSGVKPEIEQWLSTLGLMATYGKYFTAAEMRKIVTRWQRMQLEWRPLIEDIRREMEKKTPATSLEVQPLAQRWMHLAMQWMDGDFDLLKRWDAMCRKEPAAHGDGGIDARLFEYISKAIDLRLAALHRYLDADELRNLRYVSGEEWVGIGKTAEELMQQGVSVDAAAARRLAMRWNKLIDRLTNQDASIRERFLSAIRSEPILQVGLAISDEAREYIRHAYAAAITKPVPSTK